MASITIWSTIWCVPQHRVMSSTPVGDTQLTIKPGRVSMYVYHDNDYHTIYGHMSVLRVRTDDDDICETSEFSCILGISGNTGSSTGPHLHFELEPPNDNRSANPYGWIDENHNDPWEDWSGLASHDVWLRYPSITNGDVYPSGAPLTAPPINENEPGAFTVDDGGTGFVENPAGCWTADTQLGWRPPLAQCTRSESGQLRGHLEFPRHTRPLQRLRLRPQ
jgi:hypothetical protein